VSASIQATSLQVVDMVPLTFVWNALCKHYHKLSDGGWGCGLSDIWQKVSQIVNLGKCKSSNYTMVSEVLIPRRRRCPGSSVVSAPDF
jgi:hypothetical protein